MASLTPEQEFRKQLSEMPAEYLQCRSMGRHAMIPAELDFQGLFPVMGIRCMICGMEGESYRGSDGIKRTHLSHPKGDYNFRGTGRLSLEQRQEIFDTWAEEMRVSKPKNIQIAE